MVKSFLLAALATTAFVAAPSAQAATTITGAGAGLVMPVLTTGSHTSSINIASTGLVTNVVFQLQGLAFATIHDLTMVVKHNGVTATLLSNATGLSSLRSALGVYDFTSSAGTLMKNGPGLLTVNSGTYLYTLPVGNSFVGQSAAGTWDLVITDHSKLAGGVLKGWSLQITAVPEPATWAMMIGGFALVGASMRRRVTKVAFA